MTVIKEERVFFESGGLTIEGLYAPGDGSKGVVVTHPHSRRVPGTPYLIIDGSTGTTPFHQAQPRNPRS